MSKGNPNQDTPLALPVFGFLAQTREPVLRALENLETRWPGVSLYEQKFPFDQTTYYAQEMGSPLYRWWARAGSLEDPAELNRWKLISHNIETSLARENGNRTVNIDPGYITYELLVLGSFKHEGHKIHLGDGVFADMQLQYGEGDFASFPWSFADFQSDRYYDCFHQFRLYYRTERRKLMS